ncbi:PREDICTED: uncharacterized protein LOC101372029 [Odobenus rosmarus divergens]|uniref:Uncharacterized protein LOC101372029 n=1 Tax=Odobenus rosmarus divergens TaxID=9708 RepID=A0A9B0H5F9_ODORO
MGEIITSSNSEKIWERWATKEIYQLLPGPPQPPQQHSEAAAGVEPPLARGFWRSSGTRVEHRRAQRVLLEGSFFSSFGPRPRRLAEKRWWLSAPQAAAGGPPRRRVGSALALRSSSRTGSPDERGQEHSLFPQTRLEILEIHGTFVSFLSLAIAVINQTEEQVNDESFKADEIERGSERQFPQSHLPEKDGKRHDLDPDLIQGVDLNYPFSVSNHGQCSAANAAPRPAGLAAPAVTSPGRAKSVCDRGRGSRSGEPRRGDPPPSARPSSPLSASPEAFFLLRASRPRRGVLARDPGGCVSPGAAEPRAATTPQREGGRGRRAAARYEEGGGPRAERPRPAGLSAHAPPQPPRGRPRPPCAFGHELSVNTRRGQSWT